MGGGTKLKHGSQSGKRASWLEPLETRCLLSATTTLQPNLVRAADTSAGTIQGFNPEQIAQFYGFNDISFANGTVQGTGHTQTIAIVDAFNDPNIASDLQTFDSAFNIAPPPSFTEVSQTGGSVSSITTDAGWATEISLDVEWAHAMAPQSKILLVETNSDSISDLMAGVAYARSAQGVSTVSMSWGGSEFNGELKYDTYFTTPAGHRGITFVAAAGDDGTRYGPDWPSVSPNVLGVGGTTLFTDANGNYDGEEAWYDTGGGVSSLESQPAYQNGAQSTGNRAAPDVAYDADPDSGFAVYDSLAFEGYVGWQEVGGTSAGTPQWAALISIADQGRNLAHTGALDGPSGVLSVLYNLYNNADTYADTFNDITVGGSRFSYTAGVGYDALTGLGTPQAAALVTALANATAVNGSVALQLITPTHQHPGSIFSHFGSMDLHHSLTLAAAAPSSISPVQVNATVAPPVLVTNMAETIHRPITFGTVSIAAEPTVEGDVLLAALPTISSSTAPDIAVAPIAPPLSPIQMAMYLQTNARTALSPSTWFALATLDANVFADSMAAFARESASLESAIDSGAGLLRPLAITAAVVVADAVLLGCWYSNRSRQSGKSSTVCANFEGATC